MSDLQTASEYFAEIKRHPPLSSGDLTLDLLLGGGFLTGPVYFLYGPKNYLSRILMQTVVNSFLSKIDGGRESHHVAFIDGINRFNPYLISKLAVSKHLSPQYVLKRILVARTFTWNQMVEVLEEKLIDLQDDHINLVVVSGMTTLFEGASQEIPHDIPYGKKPLLNSSAFHDLKSMFSGLNRIVQETKPIIILTGPLHSKSHFKPAGGHLISHFSGVVVGLHEKERFIDYTLDQHPFYPFRQMRYWKPLLTKMKEKKAPGRFQNRTIDAFL
ncbi:MAG: hypothetical protein KAR20_20015 [Candidatus Heimdallarchaeota archaeon]|nr:hypothetical protein [Candidatus Heimdallarchaeota archaeon]